jgi:PilZ domain-containing protein
MSNPTLDSDPSNPKLPPEPPKEQRRHPRFELAVRCWITDSRHTLYLRVHDISRGGLSVRAPVPFAPARVVELGLELPGGGRVRARGEIVWVRSATATESGPRMGARFLEFVEGEEGLYELLGNA